MALFNFRKNADLNDGGDLPPEPVESVEVLRRKTLHRLIGSVILVVSGVIVFSLVFDRQPRPVPVDIAIQIPSKDASVGLVSTVSAPVPASAPAVASQPAGESSAAPATASAAAEAVRQTSEPAAAPVPAKASLSAKEEIVPPATSKPTGKADKVVGAPAVQSSPDGAIKAAESQRAKDLLEGKPAATNAQPNAAANGQTAPAAAQSERFVVQVGAFADVSKARQARLKVEKAGLKTYTQVAETAEGKRIRVRVGPYASRDEAEKAAKKIKALDMPAAILTL